MLGKTYLLLIVTLLCCGFVLFYSAAVNVQADAPFDSPLRIPEFHSPLPTPETPEPEPVTPEIELALQFIAAREGIARDQLVSFYQEEITFPTLERTYLYVTADIVAGDGSKVFNVLVDPKTMTVEPDYNAVRAAEDAAYSAKYGRLNPALYERLQGLSDTEVLPVVIWVARPAEDCMEEAIEAEIFARYPEAREALAQKGVLWAVADPELAVQIQVAYEQLLAESVGRRVQPPATWLREQGFEVNELTGMPVLAADLPKSTIVALSKRPDVAEIDLIEATETPAAESALPTDRAQHEWAKGFTGAGSLLAILKRCNIIANAACLNIIAARPSTVGATGHKSQVAAIAMCSNLFAVWHGLWCINSQCRE